MTSAPADRRTQKGLGAFYSPQILVEPLIAWAVTSPSHSVLDPSCGDGVFIEAAARHLRSLGASRASVARLLHAFDVNPQAAAITIRALCPLIGNHSADIRARSFFDLEPPGPGSAGPRVDVIATNPPYIRYQDFSGSSRAQALSRAADAGVKLTASLPRGRISLCMRLRSSSRADASRSSSLRSSFTPHMPLRSGATSGSRSRRCL